MAAFSGTASLQLLEDYPNGWVKLLLLTQAEESDKWNPENMDHVPLPCDYCCHQEDVECTSPLNEWSNSVPQQPEPGPSCSAREFLQSKVPVNSC